MAESIVSSKPDTRKQTKFCLSPDKKNKKHWGCFPCLIQSPNVTLFHKKPMRKTLFFSCPQTISMEIYLIFTLFTMVLHLRNRWKSMWGLQNVMPCNSIFLLLVQSILRLASQLNSTSCFSKMFQRKVLIVQLALYLLQWRVNQ